MNVLRTKKAGQPLRVTPSQLREVTPTMQTTTAVSTNIPLDSQPAKLRSTIYIDGFNWFFAIFRHFPQYKWLNVQSFFEEIRVDDNVVSIKYFTALVEPKPLVSARRSRQALYLNALRQLPKVRVILGAYQDREVTCRGSCRQQYLVPEEKKTDVNIAVHMIDDVINDTTDRIVLVSGDSDLEPAIAWVHKRYPDIKLNIYLPVLEEEKKNRRNDFYEKLGATVKFLPLNLFGKHQLPNPAPGGFQRPASWAVLAAAEAAPSKNQR